MCRVDPKRLVFLDEAGANRAMGRSHAWVLRGHEYVEARPMNWGDNLTLVGAIRRDGWVDPRHGLARDDREAISGLGPQGAGASLAGQARLSCSTILAAHKQAGRPRPLIRRAGATVKFLPPVLARLQSDRVGLERCVKKHIKTCAPRTRAALRRVARAGRHAVRPSSLRSLVCPCRDGNSRISGV